jgi:tetratricopeptide (TPR) repeat protein
MLSRATEVQADLILSLARREREDPAAYVRLARLRRLTGALEDAVDIVAYARKLECTDEIRGQLDLEHGRALAALGRTEEAVLAYEAAARFGPLRLVGGALAAAIELRSGNCAHGVILAAPAIEAPPPGAVPGGELELLSARCLTALGETPTALAHAALALDRAADESIRSEARWLATAVAVRTGSAIPEALRSEAKPWLGLMEENTRHEAFQASIDAWRVGVAPRRASEATDR